MSIGVAIIGCGSFTRHELLPAVQACRRLILKAIYSRTLESAEALSELAGPVDVYADNFLGNTYIDLLLRSDIHGVVISVPTMSQAKYIRAALGAGKHVLSAKPLAQNVRDAQRLLKFYHSQVDQTKTTWGVAENFRFKESFKYAAQQVQNFGRVLMFQVEVYSAGEAGNKSPGMGISWPEDPVATETDWGNNPILKDGFTLESGVHFTAAARMLLRAGSDQVASLHSYTNIGEEHLAPVDSILSIWRTLLGAQGTVIMKFGTASSAIGYNVACENGTVKLRGTTVVSIEPGGYSVEQDFVRDDSGVEQEIAAWAESIIVGKQDPLQAPEESLADLELIEKMLESGEKHGSVEIMGLQYTGASSSIPSFSS